MRLPFLALLSLTLAASAQNNTIPGPNIYKRVVYANAGENLFAAKNRARTGDTIVVGPGLYGPTATNLLKNGVNWHFMPGAVISNNYTADVGCFDNTFEGNSAAVTSIISGDLILIDNATLSVGNIIRGSITISNPLSQITFSANKLVNLSGDADAGIRVFEGTLRFNVEEFDFRSGGPALYWDGGLVYGRFKTMLAGGDSALWSEGGIAGNWFLSGDFIDSGSQAGKSASIYFKPSHPQNKLWLDVKEIFGASVAAGYGGCLTVVTGKVYLSYQKLSAVEDAGTARALIEVQSGECWLTGQKMTVTNNQHFLSQTGGKAWIRNQHYEDAGVGSSSRLYNYIVSGGTNYLQGGLATSLWGPWAKLTGGQLRIEDATIDTFSTLQGSNVCLWITGGTPVIKNSTFIPGSLFSVSNASAGDLRVWGTGGLMAKSNITTATLTVRGGSVIVDGTYVDR